MRSHVLGIDPSGAFEEGKGTTGWCILEAVPKVVVKKGSLFAGNFDTAVAYWQAHVRLLEYADRHFCGHNIHVVMEDYLLYADKAETQIHSRFETSQLIGILRMNCDSMGLPLRIQTAGEVKRRWSNEVLVRKEVIRPKGRGYILVATGEHINRHELDALRHALHLSYFYNK